MSHRFSQPGFSLIELIIAIGIFAVLVSGITYLLLGSYDSLGGKGDNREAERLAQEAIEVMKIIKERSWTDIATVASDAPNAKQVAKNGSGTWTISASSSTHGVFARGIYVYNVQRNGDGDIVSSGGTDDPATKKVVVIVAASARTDYLVETYMGNWEAFRMSQTDWSGSSGDTSWSEGQDDYDSKTNMDTTSDPGTMKIATTT